MDKSPSPRLAYDTDDAATALGVSAKNIRDWIYTGKIKGFQIGRKWFVSADELARVTRKAAA